MEGEPGIGKTALVRAFLDRDWPAQCRIVRLVGYSSEADLPYAGVDRLLVEMHDELLALSEPLRHALTVATGRAAGDPPDRFQIGAALLSLLGSAEGPLACVIDDAHLLDDASLAILAFVARRVKAEPVLLVFATRPEPAVLETLAGIEVLHLAGLDDASAVVLLNSRRAPGVDPHLAVKVVEQLGGHPLAITDLARHADAGRLALRALSVEPLPPGALVQGFYRQKIDALPEDSRLVALLAVTDTTGDIQVVRSAARLLGVPDEATGPFEDTGLVEFAERVRFRHQLVRPAVYATASSVDRRRAHLALEAASADHGFSVAATMHASVVAVTPDEEVAGRLASLADESGARGALLSRAGLLARSSELTRSGALRDERRLAAAEAALGAGAAVLAGDLLGDVEESGLAPMSRGRLLSAQAALAMFVGDPARIPFAPQTLTRAADAFSSGSAELEQRSLLTAFAYALATERSTEGVTARELGQRALAGASSTDGVVSDVLRGIHAHLLLPYQEAAPLLRQAVSAARAADDETLMQLGMCPIPLALAVWDPSAALQLTRRMIEHATSRGALQSLDTIYWTQSTTHLQLLDVAAAGRSLENVRELRRAIGYPAEHVVNAAYLALTGVPVETVDSVASTILSTGFGGAWTIVQMGAGVRLLADGEYDAAYGRLRSVTDGGFPHISRLALADLAEAAARSGRREEASAAVDALDALASVASTPWIVGLARRSRALLDASASAEDEYLAAIESSTLAAVRGDLARAHLLFGEWLRRRRRRREAREHLAIAVREFDALGVVPFASRARREFAATGEAMPPPASVAELTPQETLVADLAGEGRSNQEIAAALFISPNTVDYHLRKVFRKLGIASRRQLLERHHD